VRDADAGWCFLAVVVVGPVFTGTGTAVVRVRACLAGVLVLHVCNPACVLGRIGLLAGTQGRAGLSLNSARFGGWVLCQSSSLRWGIAQDRPAKAPTARRGGSSSRLWGPWEETLTADDQVKTNEVFYRTIGS
jgi:hypothetical protein